MKLGFVTAKSRIRPPILQQTYGNNTLIDPAKSAERHTVEIISRTQSSNDNQAICLHNKNPLKLNSGTIDMHLKVHACDHG